MITQATEKLTALIKKCAEKIGIEEENELNDEITTLFIEMGIAIGYFEACEEIAQLIKESKAPNVKKLLEIIES